MSTSPDVPAAEAIGEVEGGRVDPYVTELPDSFQDSIVRMGRSTLQCMETVRRQGRVFACIDYTASTPLHA